MYIYAGRFHCFFREAVFPLGVFLFQYIGFLCYFFFKILVSACFTIPVPLIICACFRIPICHVCSCFTIPNPVWFLSLFNLLLPLHILVAATM